VTYEVESYNNLVEHFGKIMDLNNAIAILMNDAAITMPENSEHDRARQISTLAEMASSMIKDPKVEELLDVAEAQKDFLGKDQQRNLFLMRKNWIEEASLPTELVKERSLLEMEGDKRNTKAKEEGITDWAYMQDWYDKNFKFARRMAEILKEKKGTKTLYGALLDSFSPDLEEATVEKEFAMLERELPSLIKEIKEKQENQAPAIPLKGPFPREQQIKLLSKLIKAIGFDTTRGRIDVISGHPSCAGTASDVRFTTDCDEENFLTAVGSTVHETGHALYEQNTPMDWRYSPVGRSMGMAIHESQSRIIEVQACHTPEFFQYLEKEAREIFGRPDDASLAAENLQKLATKVTPSFIRTEADEVTYAAHIILRHKLEKSLLEGQMSINDLPAKWNDGMEKLLGITPPDASKGCMQDVHWSCGLVGYFPAYTIGDMGAAQFFNAACKAKPELREELKSGNFKPLKEWLGENVHSKGSLLTTDELFVQATGEKLNANYYLNSLSERYLGKTFTPKSGLVNNFKNTGLKL